MSYFLVGNSFRVTRITGPAHNFLGLEFGEPFHASEIVVEIHPPVGKGLSRLQADSVQENVLKGVEEANREFGTHYILKRLEFVVDDSPPVETYKFLAYSIVERLVKKLPFTK